MAPLVKGMIEKTTDGFSYSGQENLRDKPTLFIGNHRDISLDPAFLNYLLHLENLNTVRIAIGDNLLDGGYAEILMKLNKSFVVHRNIKGVKETLRKLSRLSAYINQSLSVENESIWIAQKEGRANDGNDFSDEAVFKMLYLNERKNKTVQQWIKDVNLTPIVISYEFDPLDRVKAQGWDHQESWTKDQINRNDINEMSAGIFGYKGRVHLHICEPISQDIDDTKQLSETVEKEIIKNYHLWPSNQVASSLVAQNNPESFDDLKSFKNDQVPSLLDSRLKSLSLEQKERLLMAYAGPVINKKKARFSSGL
tara:strand:- start:358 stop:1287 length:930 start_codon:yes stop_codon:yes gene_type:complete